MFNKYLIVLSKITTSLQSKAISITNQFILHLLKPEMATNLVSINDSLGYSKVFKNK